jgi:poly(A) polymerase
MTAEGEIFISLSGDDAPHFSWTRRLPVKKIVAALEAARPGGARFVGGCVRDSLIGVAPKDIDIATTLTPDAVIEALHAAGLKAAPPSPSMRWPQAGCSARCGRRAPTARL